MWNNKTFFPALTGYRAIAAWMIFVYHFFPFKNPHIPAVLKNVVGEFHLGVDMFFVLSGFLITYRYFGNDKIDFKIYLSNRFARIYPMYFLLTLCVFLNSYLLTNHWDTEKTRTFILSITMTKALFKDYFFAGIPQGWTLTLEELFYFTAPLFFILIKKNKNHLYLLPIGVFLFGLTLKFLANGDFWGFMQVNIANYIFEFFAGIALALAIRKRLLEKVPLKFFTYFGLTVIVLYLFTRHAVAATIDLKNDVARAAELFSVSVFGIAPLLYGLIFEKTFLQKILSLDLMVLLGKSSYVFYLIHKGFIPILFDGYISGNKMVLFLFLNLLSVLLFHFIEEPFNNYIRRKFAKQNVEKKSKNKSPLQTPLFGNGRGATRSARSAEESAQRQI